MRRHRAFAVALACLLAACGREPELSPRVRGAPNARHDIAKELAEARKKPHHPGDGGGRAWLEEGADRAARVGEPGRFAIVYEAGPHGIAKGGSLFFQAPYNWSWSPFLPRDLLGWRFWACRSPLPLPEAFVCTFDRYSDGEAIRSGSMSLTFVVDGSKAHLFGTVGTADVTPFRNEDGGESVVFSDQADQLLYRQDLSRAGEVAAAGESGEAVRSTAGRQMFKVRGTGVLPSCSRSITDVPTPLSQLCGAGVPNLKPGWAAGAPGTAGGATRAVRADAAPPV